MKKNQVDAAAITAEVIKGWKQAHGSVFMYKAEDGKVAYFRSPSRQEMEAATALATSNKFLQSNAVLAKATFLGGDECIVSEDKYFFGLSAHLKSIIKKVEGELTEL